MSTGFIHLNLHTEYSLIDGLIHIEPLVDACRAQQIPAIALTDHHNIFAYVKFYKAATRAGIKPIFGADVCITNPDNIESPFRVTLLCQNNNGYKQLKCLLSRAYIDGQEYGVPRINYVWLEQYSEGLIAIASGQYSDLGQALLNEKTEHAQVLLEKWCTFFCDRFYLAIHRTGRPLDETFIKKALPFCSRHQLPIVATNEVRFLNADDFHAHEARVCIHDGFTLADPKRPKKYSNQQYLRSPQQMADLFADLPQALENSVEIAKRCNVTLTLGESYFPKFTLPHGYTVEDFMIEQSERGLAKRLEMTPDLTPENRQIYFERLHTELKVILSMGFAGYFLIVADFISWAKQNDVPVGPGRGSGAGSLVAYSLGITGLDPLSYALLFERFLNPERVSMPDFDIDFCMEGRDRVIDYVAEKYGRDSVSQIITFGTMAAKAVVRDVGRVLGHPYGFVDKIAKLIPFELGITLEKALQEDELKRRYDTEEEVRSLLDLAQKLEGVARNAGKHAGGVVIAPSQLTDFTALYCEPGGESLVSQFDKDDVEQIGLVKFDFLGLRTLTIISWALKSINQHNRQAGIAEIDIDLIPTDDTATYELLKACNTTAVFQLESRGMKELIKRLQPDCFEEIVALVALFRPGPLQSGMVDDFINRKHGLAKVEYPHPDLAAILQLTYGVILYQEQVMQISQVLAGYTLGGADLLRRAMGKKKPEEMAKQRDIFTKGATARGVDVDVATHIFDLMEKFAGYGFNKSHSAAYALVAYQTAWLKAHYPAAFMAAVLSSDMDNTDKVVNFIEDARAMGLTILPPHVNHSQYMFTVRDTQTIVYGLGAIKGIGESAIDAIVESSQKGGPYLSLIDFCMRVDLRKVNRRVFEALIRAGAFDGLGRNRASLMATLDIALKAAEQQHQRNELGQHDLFSQSLTDNLNPLQTRDIEVADWPEQFRLEAEKETLGFYLTGHPFNRYVPEFSNFLRTRLDGIHHHLDKTIFIAGLVLSVRKIITKRGKRMAIVTIDDNTAHVDVVVFSEVLDLSPEIYEKDHVIIFQGTPSVDEFNGGTRFTAERAYDVVSARETLAKRLVITLPQTDEHDRVLGAVASVLQRYSPGACPVTIFYQHANASAQFNLDQNWRVRPDDRLLQELAEIPEINRVEMAF